MTAPVVPSMSRAAWSPTAFRLYPVTPTLSVAVGRIQNGVSCNVLVTRHALNRCENRCFFIAVGQRQRDRAFGRIARGIGRNDREIVARLRPRNPKLDDA